MENLKYKEYADKVFSFFEGMRTGQGGFFFRYLLANRNKITQEEYKIIILVAYNLMATDYLDTDDGHFVKLTVLGYDYTQGGELTTNKICLNDLIRSQKTKELQFDTLWTLIGKENIAPFYTNGRVFFDAIRPFFPELPTTYSLYTQSLVKAGKSASRVSWFKDLYLSLKSEDVDQFLHDLSRGIEKYYAPEVPEVQSNLPLYPFGDIVAEVKRPVQEDKKKVVFITYCWEKNIDPNHCTWVHHLADELSKDFDVIIDVKQPLGIEFNRFMEQTISRADKVIIIATPEYKRRADNRERGVGYETSLITDDLVSDMNRIKFIPIIRKGTKETSYPTYLGSRKGLSMTDQDDYQSALNELIYNLKNF